MATPTDLFEIKAIAAGKDQTLALLTSGEVLGWGGPGSGRYASPYADICSPIKESDGQPAYIGQPDYYSDISAGFGLSLGVSKQQPFIWGFAQEGIGSRSLITENPSPIHGLKHIIKTAVGQLIFAAIDAEHSLYTWGLNLDGALGRSTSQFNSLPEIVPRLPPIHDVGIGDNFMLALSRDQRIYSWGSNSTGQLGLGHLASVTSPQPIALPAAIKCLAVGSTHALATSSDGKVYGWGSNNYGQSGGGALPFITSPKLISFPERIAEVAAGMHYSLALAVSGRVYAWGWNGFGQLGLGDLQSRSCPTIVPALTDVRSVATGEMHAIAVGKNHLLGWGCNSSNQIGKAAIKQMIPSPFLTISDQKHAKYT
jgi:alpha-tubulin suppressor-like RCC1 family protein